MGNQTRKMQRIRMVWCHLQQLLIEGACLRQTPGLMVRQRGLQGLGYRGYLGGLVCRVSFFTPLAALFIFLAAIAWAWIVAASFAHRISQDSRRTTLPEPTRVPQRCGLLKLQ